jgi:hypothetical protein
MNATAVSEAFPKRSPPPEWLRRAG